MNNNDLQMLLDRLITEWENEVVEFKHAGNDYDTDRIGRYFSAMCNEANLRDIEGAWLVFGVDNKTRKVVGSDYRDDKERLQSLKMQMAENTEPSVTMRNIHVLHHADGRVVLFEIPPSPQGLPIAWKGHYYARSGESLTSLGLDKLDQIRAQSQETDWSIKIVTDARIDHLDPVAIGKARESYARKYSNRFSLDEIQGWSDIAFLDRSRLTIEGKITRAALLLLGKPESAFLLSPHPVQMTWKLEGAERAYEHFGLPFLLNSTALYQKIRNVQIRILPDNQLFPVEVSKYEQKIVLEALHNCIAHQDYTKSGRIIVTEYLDRLVFENEGSFYEGKPADYISGEKTPRRYRNAFLAQAMTELNMIDTMGYGIHEIHTRQAKRYFPLPDFDLQNGNSVKMTLHGKVVDPAYSKALMERADLTLPDIIALDHIQKKRSLPDDVVKRLRKKGLIEGRKPNLHISDKIAKATDSKADYIKTRSQDDTFYAKLVLDYLEKFKKASRKDINILLFDKLSNALDDEQKTNKIGALLTKLRRNGKIWNAGSRTKPEWRIAERKAE
ncbi:MAG: putative DNA binding domain-containing protein [Desulfotignum sp.]|nr:putative DNA binding domain-containing protein [Desulfotignum sp.]